MLLCNDYVIDIYNIRVVCCVSIISFFTHSNEIMSNVMDVEGDDLQKSPNIFDNFKYASVSLPQSTIALNGVRGLLPRLELMSDYLNLDSANQELTLKKTSSNTTATAASHCVQGEQKLVKAKEPKKPRKLAPKKPPKEKKTKEKIKKSSVPKSITARLALRYKDIEDAAISCASTKPEENFEGESEESSNGDIAFTQIARKQHKDEFNIMNKLSGKRQKNKIMSTVSSKITSHKARQEYQLMFATVPAKDVKETDEESGGASGKDLNHLIILKKTAVSMNQNPYSNVSFSSVISPPLGVKIVQSACLEFPFIPKSSRSKKNLETIEVLNERYFAREVDVEISSPPDDNHENEIVASTESPKEPQSIEELFKLKVTSSKPISRVSFCTFVPRPAAVSLFEYSSTAPSDFTQEDVITLHLSDEEYFDMDIKPHRKRKRVTDTPLRVTKNMSPQVSHISGTDTDEKEILNLDTEEDSPGPWEIPASDEDEYEEIEIISESAFGSNTVDLVSSPALVSAFSQELPQSPFSVPNTKPWIELSGSKTFTGDKQLLSSFESTPIKPQINSGAAQNNKNSAISETLSPYSFAVNDAYSPKTFQPLPAENCESLQITALTPLPAPVEQNITSEALGHVGSTPKESHFAPECSPPIPWLEDTIEVIEIAESPYGSGCESEEDDYFEIFEHAAKRFKDKLDISLPPVESPLRMQITAPDLPNYDKMTTPQLRDQLDKWGFKALKTRKNMIELLKSCKVYAEPQQAIPDVSNDNNDAAPCNLPPVSDSIDAMSTGELKKIMGRIGIKHDGSRSRMIDIIKKCYSSPEKDKTDDFESMDSTMRSNIAVRISEHIKQDKDSVSSIWVRILCFEPIGLDELSVFLEARMDIKFDPKFLRNWCDSHGVTTTLVLQNEQESQ